MRVRLVRHPAPRIAPGPAGEVVRAAAHGLAKETADKCLGGASLK